MNRRLALKQLGFVTAGAMLLPGCVKEARQATVSLTNLKITGDQEAIIAELVETIIPETDIPGAKSLKVPEFVLRMVDDCQSPEVQKEYEQGTAAFSEAVEKEFGESFDALTPEKRKVFLEGIERKMKDEQANGKLSPLSSFYATTKRYTIQGFTNSEYIMTHQLPYNMLPGKFIGCVPITDKNNILTVIG